MTRRTVLTVKPKLAREVEPTRDPHAVARALMGGLASSFDPWPVPDAAQLLAAGTRATLGYGLIVDAPSDGKRQIEEPQA